MMIVQDPPSDIRNEITICSDQEMVVAVNNDLFRILFSESDPEILKDPAVYDQIQYECQYAYDRIKHAVITVLPPSILFSKICDSSTVTAFSGFTYPRDDAEGQDASGSEGSGTSLYQGRGCKDG